MPRTTRALDREWQDDYAHSTGGITALRRWDVAEPALRGLDDLDHLWLRSVPCRGRRAAPSPSQEAELTAEREAAVQDWLGGRDVADIVVTVKQLSVPQRIYLDGLRRHWAGHLDFVGIAQAVGIQPRWVETYLLRYQALGLVFVDDQQWHLHPGILDGRVPTIP